MRSVGVRAQALTFLPKALQEPEEERRRRQEGGPCSREPDGQGQAGRGGGCRDTKEPSREELT